LKNQGYFAKLQWREDGFSNASLEELHLFLGLQELLHGAITGRYG